MKNVPLLILLVSLTAGCATVEYADTNSNDHTPDLSKRHTLTENPFFENISAEETSAGKDRAAILAMQGDYLVDFTFKETVALERGYRLHDDKTTGGYETVIVVENTPSKVVLQHILVMGGHVIKHWRQDWMFEARERFEFVADQTWEVRAVDLNKITGHWTQCVYEVSDAPRYCGTGKWNHRYGVSTWTSDRTWRPLPRREYTKRSDYNALNAENRHTITPNGWTHEQDNTKTLRNGRATEKTLVREFGFNDYRNITDYDFGPATQYWEQTSDYWLQVRSAWDRRLLPGNTLQLSTEVDGMPIITGTFAQADRAKETTRKEQRNSIEQLLTEWTVWQSSTGSDSGGSD